MWYGGVTEPERSKSRTAEINNVSYPVGSIGPNGR
jgi:hypothetical protein